VSRSDPVPLSAARSRPRAYHGACACGSVRFRIETQQGAPSARCICARCRGQGLEVLHVPQAGFALLTGREALTEMPEAARDPHHFFCGACGEACFGQGARGLVSVNVACLDRGDPGALLPVAPHPPAAAGTAPAAVAIPTAPLRPVGRRGPVFAPVFAPVSGPVCAPVSADMSRDSRQAEPHGGDPTGPDRGPGMSAPVSPAPPAHPPTLFRRRRSGTPSI